MLEHPKDFEAYKATGQSMNTMGNQQETIAAWVAAHLDSDGTICFNIRMRHRSSSHSNIRPHFLPWIVFSNNHRGLVEAFAARVNQLGVGCLIGDAGITSAGNQHYSVTIAGAKRAYKLLPLVLPWLVAKKDRAEATIKFIESRLSKPMNVTYTREEIEWALSTKAGSSETLRKALLKAIA